jgi:hypothetical protein
MRKRSFVGTALLAFGMGWSAAAWAGGDRITLRDGKVYLGDILFHGGTYYVIATGGGSERVQIADIAKIEFGPVVTASASEKPAPPASETVPT